MSSPRISVIIPCYNYARFLAEAVESVRIQTWSDWECLIVDDGSPDNTREVATGLAEADARVKYLYKPNGGLSSARNHGIKSATGEYICFLDADDLLDRQKLEKQLACFVKDPAADIVYGKAMFFKNDAPGTLYPDKTGASVSELSEFSGKGEALITLLTRKNITVVSAPMIRKSVFDKVGTFDESYRSYEDWQFWARCALAGCAFVYHAEPPVCTYIRFGHESMMSDQKKLLRAGIQLRKFLASALPLKNRPYNYYRLLRSTIKLLLT